MQQITLSKEVFDEMKPLLKPYIKDHCNYCGDEITKDTFGFLSRDITSCGNLLCLSHAITDGDEIAVSTGSAGK